MNLLRTSSITDKNPLADRTKSAEQNMDEKLQQAALRLLRYSWNEIGSYEELTEQEKGCVTKGEFDALRILVKGLAE